MPYIVKARAPQDRIPLPTDERSIYARVPRAVQAAAAKDRGLPGPHVASPSDDPLRFLRVPRSTAPLCICTAYVSWAPSTPLPCSGRRRTSPPPLRICGSAGEDPLGVRAHILTSAPSPSVLSLCHLSRRESPWQKDEAHINCQGLPLCASWRAERD
jgi:hypothetical protein